MRNNHKKIKKIALVFNLKKAGVKDDYQEEYDEPATIYSLRKEIELLGFKVVLLEQDSNFLKKISSAKVDFVFNIAEGKGGVRSRESQVPCILESLSIPYLGSDPVSLGICLDKYLANTILKSAGIPVPDMYMVATIKDMAACRQVFKKGIFFVVKPRWEGSSKGITSNSLVDNLDDASKRALFIFKKYKQPALVEEFVPGDEITTAVLGSKNCRLLGMMKIAPKDHKEKFFLYSIENKRNWQNTILYHGQDEINISIRRKIEKYALAAHSILELRDISRIDFRLDKNSLPRIIDVNPLPGLSPRYSDLPILYKLKGGSYRGLVKIIFKEALARYGVNLK